VPPKVKCKNPLRRTLNSLRRRTCSCGSPLFSVTIENKHDYVRCYGPLGQSEAIALVGPQIVHFECVHHHTWSEPFSIERGSAS